MKKLCGILISLGVVGLPLVLGRMAWWGVPFIVLDSKDDSLNHSNTTLSTNLYLEVVSKLLNSVRIPGGSLSEMAEPLVSSFIQTHIALLKPTDEKYLNQQMTQLVVKFVQEWDPKNGVKSPQQVWHDAMTAFQNATAEAQISYRKMIQHLNEVHKNLTDEFGRDSGKIVETAGQGFRNIWGNMTEQGDEAGDSLRAGMQDVNQERAGIMEELANQRRKLAQIKPPGRREVVKEEDKKVVVVASETGIKAVEPVSSGGSLNGGYLTSTGKNSGARGDFTGGGADESSDYILYLGVGMLLAVSGGVFIAKGRLKKRRDLESPASGYPSPYYD